MIYLIYCDTFLFMVLFYFYLILFSFLIEFIGLIYYFCTDTTN